MDSVFATVAERYDGDRRILDAAKHAAGGFLRIVELREGAAQTEAFRVAGVNSGDERGHKAIQEFGAELPAHEGGDGLINFRSAGGAECVARYLPLGGW